MTDLKYDILHDYDFSLSHLGFVRHKSTDPDWKVNIANKDYFIAAVCLDGKAHYRFDGREVTVTPGDLLFFPKGHFHSAETDGEAPWNFVSASFDMDFYDKLCEKKLDKLPRISRPGNFSHISSLMQELARLWQGKRRGYRIRCRSILMELLYHLIVSADSESSKTVPHQYQINRVVERLENPGRDFLTLQKMAEMTKLSPSYFRQLFKEITGYSPIQYQNRVKVYKAKDLIMAGECNVSEAAYALGYEDIYYFSRLFKKVIGINPSEFL